MAKRSIRLQEVAEHAGVAFITAWRALNEPGKVSQKTIDKVIAASDDLGYVTNSVARSLVSAKTGVVGVIVPTLNDSIFADTVQGISDELEKQDRELLIGLSEYSSVHETRLVKTFIGRQIDGLILTGRNHEDVVRKVVSQSATPVVETWDYGESCLDMVVGFSNRGMAYEVTRFLATKGYREIAFVSPMKRARAIERFGGYKDAIRDLGMPLRDELNIDCEPTYDGGARAFDRLSALDRPPDAIFFNGDTMAIGAHLHASSRGVRFPEDMAIIGIHDDDLSKHLSPPLSTVHIPRYEMGKEAAQALLKKSEDSTYEQITDLRFEIMDRGTT